MRASTAKRIRWFGVWILIALWFAALSFRWLGDLLHLLLAAAALLVVYELLAEDGASEEAGAPADEVQALRAGSSGPGGSAGRSGSALDRGRPPR